MALDSQDTGTAPKTVTILGSTGSIGQNTLDLVARSPEKYDIIALSAHRNADKLIEQALAFRPQFVAIGDAAEYARVKEALAPHGIDVGAGETAVIEAAAMNANWVMAAIVGMAGLKPTLAAIRRGATVALANKESLVCAGELMIAEVAKHGATLLPVDSEHNAIFQVFDFNAPDSVEKIILTASGGPFRELPMGKLRRATPDEAVKHPNWSMGAKISVDSATLMNKGLELIEAFYLFPVELESIEVVVHPQSVIHSMVAYRDGSVLAQLGSPDMRTPIGYTLGWPERPETPAPRLDFTRIAQLTFEAPDLEKFPCLSLARQSLGTGGTAPAILNAANEETVAAFLASQIGFMDIASINQEIMMSLGRNKPVRDFEELYEICTEARKKAQERIAVCNAAQ